MMNITDFFPCVVAFAVTTACIWLLRPLAMRLGLVDTPHGRKQHTGEVPVIGGLAMFLGFLFALLTLPISLVNYRSFIAGCALLVFMGVLDDFQELSAKSRLVAQIIAALLMTAWGKVDLHNMGNLFFYKDILLGDWSLPITVLAVVALINAINMTDGIDGLAGGLSFIAFAFLTFLAIHGGQFVTTQILLLLLAVSLAFLLCNFPLPGRKRALVFMGDAGSMFLGFGVVWFLIQLSQTPQQVVHPVTMLWITALPLFEIVGVIVRRVQKRTSLFIPDREHLHHLLLALGYTPFQITTILCVVAIACGLLGVIANFIGIAEGVMFIGFLLLFALYLWMLSSLRKRLEQQSLNSHPN